MSSTDMISFNIRTAHKEDAGRIREIYRFYAENTLATFADESPPLEEWEKKIEHTMKTYPFFVAEDEIGGILGFVYASALRPHAAYRWSAESTLYLAPSTPKRRGIGRALQEKLEAALILQGFKFVWAVVTAENTESVAFHKKLGFQEMGRFSDMGNKFGKWLGVVWLKKQLAELTETPRKPTPFCELENREALK